METNQEFLIASLSAAIHGEELRFSEINKVNFKTIFQEAQEFDICGLLYPIMKKFNETTFEDDETINQWKNSAIISEIIQIQFIEQMNKVLKKFCQEDIEVIVLKGLTLRDLYPKAELRSMSDADLLLHKEDMKKGKTILLNMEYRQDHSDSKHCVFIHKSYPPIELHWRIVDKTFIKDISYFEKNIWENAIKVKVCDQAVLALSSEDQVLHLCLHMIMHMVSIGLGIRQLCDLVLFVESKFDKIDWNAVYQSASECNIEKFTIVIFDLCKRLFNMPVPDNLDKLKPGETKNIDSFVSYIFTMGIYTKEVQAVKQHSYENIRSIFMRFKLYFSIIFPWKQNFDIRYSYAQKWIILTPIAWIHRFIYVIFSKEFTKGEKISYFKNRVNIVKNRTKLLKWLELK